MAIRVADGRLEELQVYRLLQCVHKGNKEQIEKLIALGVRNVLNVIEPRRGKGALHLAAVANNLDMAEFLLNRRASPNVQDKMGRTPVMLAAELGHDEMVSLLVKNKANVNLLDQEGKGVLFFCVYPTKRHMRCLQTAVQAKASVNNVSLSGQHVLHLACSQADCCLPMCLLLLEKGADPNAADQGSGRTALMEAARVGALELVRQVLQRGANPNARDHKQLHAAHLAAEGGFFEILRVLCAYGADVGTMSSAGDTPLHFAARGGFAECCRFLSQRGCNAKLKNEEGVLPRQVAKERGHRKAVKELKKAERLQAKLSRPADRWTVALYDWSQEHETRLKEAIEASGSFYKDSVSVEVFVKVLQDLHAPVEDPQLHKLIQLHDRRREGVLNLADFFKGTKYVQKTMVMASYGPKKKKKGGKKGKKAKKGKFSAPLPICTVPQEQFERRPDGGPPTYMLEAYHHNTDHNRFSRDNPPQHPIEDDSAWYIDEPHRMFVDVTYCTRTGDLDSLQLALEQGVPVDVKDRFYKTPLMTACAYGNHEVAQFLIKMGANVNAKDNFSWTPLHHACHAGQLDMVELLVGAGAEVDSPALNGATPLMRAIESCRPSCVDFLIKAGAKVNAKNKKDQNCLDIARAFADLRVVELVKAKMDSLPKPKVANKMKRGATAKPPPKPKQAPQPRPATATTNTAKDKMSQAQSSTTQTAPTEEKRKTDKNTVVMFNTQIISGPAGPMDISFKPRTVWDKQQSTSSLLQQRERRRQRLAGEVDFDDFLMPFGTDMRRKAAEAKQ